MNHIEQKLVAAVKDFVLAGFNPRAARSEPPTHPLWAKMRQLGTELWLDTGSIKEASELWTREFSALTTNNTLLNREVQSGAYDRLVVEADKLLQRFDMPAQRRKLEMAFILNAYHALRLVERFDAKVSVEEHTDLAFDAKAAVAYAHRFYAICPERFIVKLPLTPAGLVATRALAGKVPVNHTLGFSARQNYLIARFARPSYVNVFMGRLNAFVADNALGSGAYVGERATLATQQALRALRARYGMPTKPIGASTRSGGQIRDLAGLDVMTLPPKAAAEFLQLGVKPEDLADRTGADYKVELNAGVSHRSIALDTLWEVPLGLIAALDSLHDNVADRLDEAALLSHLAEHGVKDLLPRWTGPQIAASAAEGKIPKLANWAKNLAAGAVGLDALMNLAGLNSFIADQHAMDQRVADVLGGKTG
ncbi:MAG: transaldolase [Planctomycetota bacterium]|nr:transaldolase [Planctomycetota bacterium]